MSEPTPYALSKLFTNLVGRKVTFAQAALTVDGKIKQMFGIYTVLPGETAIVVKADLPLLGSLGGALVGLPDSGVKEHLGATPLDELMRDAIHEVLNIASTALTDEARAVFVKMVTEPLYIDGAAGTMLKKPDHRTYFNVTVDGYQGGKFQVFSQSVRKPG
jgi:hypothetical protein